MIGIFSVTVFKWKNRTIFVDKKRKRKSKLNKKINKVLLVKVKNKFTGINGAGSTIFQKHLKNKFGLQISHQTVNSWFKKF